MYDRVLFVFRRDLRVPDNTALIAASKAAKQVVPVFLLDDVQLGERNSWFSSPAVQFMCDSLADLHAATHQKLMCYKTGDVPAKIVSLCAANDADAVFFNKDYTPYAQERDAAICAACDAKGIDVNTFDDALLLPVDAVQTGSGTPFLVFGAFLKKHNGFSVQPVDKHVASNFSKSKLKSGVASLASLTKLYEPLEKLWVDGGRRVAEELLARSDVFRAYDANRNDPNKPSTNMSAHLKFGCVSAREVYEVGKRSGSGAKQLLTELVWRDFFAALLWARPDCIRPDVGAFSMLKKLRWKSLDDDGVRAKFAAWKRGRTGFPLVDAGIRQLLATGYMHGRVRMVVASFLVRDIGLHWEHGSKFFYKHLYDADVASNTLNWQLVCSSMRLGKLVVMNPWLQQSKFDKRAEYVKTWVPELRDVPAGHIHKWFDKHALHEGSSYGAPILNHKTATQHLVK